LGDSHSGELLLEMRLKEKREKRTGGTSGAARLKKRGSMSLRGPFSKRNVAKKREKPGKKGGTLKKGGEGERLGPIAIETREKFSISNDVFLQ